MIIIDEDLINIDEGACLADEEQSGNRLLYSRRALPCADAFIPFGEFCFWVLPNIFSLNGKYMPAQGTALCETARPSKFL